MSSLLGRSDTRESYYSSPPLRSPGKEKDITSEYALTVPTSSCFADAQCAVWLVHVARLFKS